MLGLQNLLREDVVGGQERHRAQIAAEVGKPETSHRERDQQIGPGDVEAGREVRLNQPEQIDVAHADEPDCQPNQTRDVTFERAREQQEKRHEELEDHQKKSYSAPTSMQPADVPGNFLGQVSGPDDQPLREGEVGPDHHKSQHELAVVMDEVRAQQLRHGLVPEQNALDDHGEAEGGDQLSGYEQQAVDSRDPAGIERHDPVNGGKRNRERVEDDAGAADCFETEAVGAHRWRVLLSRPARQQVREEIPDCEVNNRSPDEAGPVQVTAHHEAVVLQVLADDRILNGFERHRPGVESGYTEYCNRNEEGSHQRNRAHGCAEDAADHHPPSATGQMTNHEDHHGAEAYAQPIHERNEIAAEEGLRIGEAQGNRNDGGHDTDIQRAASDQLDDRRRGEVQIGGVGRAHLDSSGPAVW